MPDLMREHRCSCLPVCRIGQAVNSAAVDLLWLHRICSHQIHHSHSATLITCGPTVRKTRPSKRQTANNLLPDAAGVGLTQGYAASVLGVPGRSGDGASGRLYIWHRDEIPFNKNCRDYIKCIRYFPLNLRFSANFCPRLPFQKPLCPTLRTLGDVSHLFLWLVYLASFCPTLTHDHPGRKSPWCYLDLLYHRLAHQNLYSLINMQVAYVKKGLL